MFSKKDNKNAKKLSEGLTITEIAADGVIRLIPSNYQHIGSRVNQEDAFAFSDLGDAEHIKRNGILAIVADGMGGLELGEEASKVAVASFLREYNLLDDKKNFQQRLKQALTVANTAVYDLAYEGESNIDRDLGTTLVAALIHDNRLYWLSVGDSRVYLFRDKQLKQLSKDHIYANQLQSDVENGRISLKEAELHPERGYLTSYLGLPNIKEVDYSNEPIPLLPEDILLLCTDGLFNTLNDNEIIEIMEVKNNLSEHLIRAALAKNNPYQDNITVITISVFAR